MATGGVPASLKSSLGTGGGKTCTLDATTRSKVESALAPYYKLFSGGGETGGQARFHVVGGLCNNSCSAPLSHGYMDLSRRLGGHQLDTCQKDLERSMQQLLDSVRGAASPLVLDIRPASASLVVSLDHKFVARSRSKGFDYDTHSNSLIFNNVKYSKGSQVVVGYFVWRGHPGL